MKGTILDFLKLATEKPDLADELVEFATKHGFEFSDEVSDEELETVAGGAANWEQAASLADSATEAAKDSASASTDIWKQSLTTLAEHQQHQQQNTKTMTNI